MFLPDYFEKYSIDNEKALAYGFSKQGEKFHYDQQILDGDFKLYVTVQSKQVHFWLVDQETGDDYVQLHLDQMVGQYVGQVREACQQALEDIRSLSAGLGRYQKLLFCCQRFFVSSDQALGGLDQPAI